MADRTDRAELPERLRDAARSHRPDRDRMLARVERGMTEQGVAEHSTTGRSTAEPSTTGRSATARGRPEPPPESVRQGRYGKRPVRQRTGAPWMRIVAVTAAVAGAIGLGGLAVGAVTGDGEPTQSVVTSSGPSVPHRPSSTPVGSKGPARHHSSPRSSAPTTGHHTKGATHPAVPRSGGKSTTVTTPPPTTVTTAPGAPGGDSTRTGGATQDGSLNAQGSVDSSSNAYWTQSDVVLTNSEPLTALTVEMRVARTEGVSTAGQWSSVSTTTASVTVEGDELVYRWTLNSGQPLAPGSHTFSGQFNHAPGDRDSGGDTYTVHSQGPDGTSSVDGGF